MVLICPKEMSLEIRSWQGNNLDSKVTSKVCSDGFFMNLKNRELVLATNLILDHT